MRPPRAAPRSHEHHDVGGTWTGRSAFTPTESLVHSGSVLASLRGFGRRTTPANLFDRRGNPPVLGRRPASAGLPSCTDPVPGSPQSKDARSTPELRNPSPCFPRCAAPMSPHRTRPCLRSPSAAQATARRSVPSGAGTPRKRRAASAMGSPTRKAWPSTPFASSGSDGTDGPIRDSGMTTKVITP